MGVFFFFFFFFFKSVYCPASNAGTFYLQTCAMNHTVRQREDTSAVRRKVEGVNMSNEGMGIGPDETSR
jgi:hypothetical protein